MRVALFVSCFVLVLCGVSYAAEPIFRDINAKPKKFFGKEFMAAGVIVQRVYKTDIRCYVASPDQKGFTRTGFIKINVYHIDDGTDRLFLMTPKTLEDGAEISLKTKILATWRTGVKKNTYEVFREIFDPEASVFKGESGVQNFSSIIHFMKSYEPWVMLIDMEGESPEEEPVQEELKEDLMEVGEAV